MEEHTWREEVGRTWQEMRQDVSQGSEEKCQGRNTWEMVSRGRNQRGTQAATGTAVQDGERGQKEQRAVILLERSSVSWGAVGKW